VEIRHASSSQYALRMVLAPDGANEVNAIGKHVCFGG